MTSLDYKEDARDLHAFKELRFFLSNVVPLEIRCSVSRLELPLVADYLLGADTISGSYADDQQQQRKREQVSSSANQSDGTNSPTGAISDSKDDSMDEIVKGIMSEPELVATCQVLSDSQPMHAVPMRWENRCDGRVVIIIMAC